MTKPANPSVETRAGVPSSRSDRRLSDAFATLVQKVGHSSAAGEYRTVYQLASLGYGMDDASNVALVTSVIDTFAPYFKVRRGRAGILPKFLPNWNAIESDFEGLIEGDYPGDVLPHRRVDAEVKPHESSGDPLRPERTSPAPERRPTVLPVPKPETPKPARADVSHRARPSKRVDAPSGPLPAAPSPVGIGTGAHATRSPRYRRHPLCECGCPVLPGELHCRDCVS